MEGGGDDEAVPSVIDGTASRSCAMWRTRQSLEKAQQQPGSARKMASLDDVRIGNGGLTTVGRTLAR